MLPQGHADRNEEITITEMEIFQLPLVIDSAAEI